MWVGKEWSEKLVRPQCNHALSMVNTCIYHNLWFKMGIFVLHYATVHNLWHRSQITVLEWAMWSLPYLSNTISLIQSSCSHLVLTHCTQYSTPLSPWNDIKQTAHVMTFSTSEELSDAEMEEEGNALRNFAAWGDSCSLSLFFFFFFALFPFSSFLFPLPAAFVSLHIP